MDYKIILGVTATVLGFIGYFPYIRDTLRGTTRPHVFSWAVWGVMETIAFFAQIAGGASAGAWATGTSAVVMFFIVAIALMHADKQIVFFDWFALAGALIGIVLWRLTANPLLAIVCVTIADAFAFIPTFRKAYHKPHEETVIEYVFSALKWMVSLFALGSFNLTTALYPISLIFTNSAFVVMALVRRRNIS